MTQPLYLFSHSPIDVHFSKSSDDFVVREIPLYTPTGQGEWAYLHIQKKGISTSEAIKILSSATGAKARDFGYAGLKDKQGLTSQYICIHRSFVPKLESFCSTSELKILSIDYHENKLKTGHLKGNSFFIRLKKVSPADSTRIISVLNEINTHGFANYFGYQRFGKDKDNAQTGLAMLEQRYNNEKQNRQKKHKFNRRLDDFLLSAFQSELFNRWLNKRVEISRFCDEFSPAELVRIYNIPIASAKQLKAQNTRYRLLEGEVLGHYPFGKCFLADDLSTQTQRFKDRDITSCGLLFGAKDLRASGELASRVESEIFSPYEHLAPLLNGGYRYAISFIQDLEYSYQPEKAHFLLSFSLQKGSYATTVLGEILHKDILS